MIPIRNRVLSLVAKGAIEEVLGVLERSTLAVKEGENLGVDTSEQRTIEQIYFDTKKELLERARDVLNVELENYNLTDGDTNGL